MMKPLWCICMTPQLLLHQHLFFNKVTAEWLCYLLLTKLRNQLMDEGGDSSDPCLDTHMAEKQLNTC